MFRPTQSGQTSMQMQGAPLGAVYVWCNHSLYYPRRLACFLQREDLVIVSPSWLERFNGRRPSGLTIDHAAVLTSFQRDVAAALYRSNFNLSLIKGLTGGVD